MEKLTLKLQLNYFVHFLLHKQLRKMEKLNLQIQLMQTKTNPLKILQS